MSRIWFTSDTHFGHSNVIKYSERPFLTSAEKIICQKASQPQATTQDKDKYRQLTISQAATHEHDQQLIANWNRCVKKGDRIYHLGDFSFADENYAKKILTQLNGNIYFIRGNHDRNIKALTKHCVWVKDYFELKIKDPIFDHHRGKIILMHYAMKVWNGSHHGSWHLYGHSHATLADDPQSLSIDVGVDAVAKWYATEEDKKLRYRPLSWEEVKNILHSKIRKEIHSERLTLRAYTKENNNDFIALNTDPQVRKYMDGVKTVAQAQQLFYKVITNPLCWAVHHNNTYIGHCFLERERQNAELGFLLFPQYWNQGYATEIAIALTNYAQKIQLQEIIATVDCDHKASINVLKKAGFTLKKRAQDEYGMYYVYSKVFHEDLT